MFSRISFDNFESSRLKKNQSYSIKILKLIFANRILGHNQFTTNKKFVPKVVYGESTMQISVNIMSGSSTHNCCIVGVWLFFHFRISVVILFMYSEFDRKQINQRERVSWFKNAHRKRYLQMYNCYKISRNFQKFNFLPFLYNVYNINCT